METSLIIWWVVASIAVGLGCYWFFIWLLNKEELEQSEEEKQEELKTIISDPYHQTPLAIDQQ